MKSRILSVAAMVAVLSPASLAFAQQPQDQPGSIHGHVQNAAGMAQGVGDVKLTTDRSTSDDKTRKYEYSFPVDANGDFKGTGIKPGKYVMFYIVKGATVDYINDVEVKPGEDTAQNDDMTREEFLKAMTPEQKKQLEEFKKANAATVAANKTVANLNGLLTGAREDEKAGKYDDAIAKMTQATQQKPDEAILWLELGNAQLGAKKFDDAATSLQKAADTNAASKKPNPSISGSAYNNLGQALVGAKKPNDALAAYDKAAAAEPAKAGVYYYNEAAVLYNSGNHDQAAQAADKAIAADPTKAESYYIKGQSLIDKATLDPKTQKMQAPDGCLEAYLKYLELAPNGAHAADVQGIVSAFDQKQVSDFKANKGKKK
ncbi:tetratricopeptide repeat protein [Terriglobus sp. ADX1]|uniref:tetratricopeptide repeat protein n=1 Tax=Terriglobus sp. ADX1 TaxID=2794063 RepID=UPI002FE56BE3